MKNLSKIATGCVVAIALVACGKAPTSEAQTGEVSNVETAIAHTSVANMDILSNGSFEGRNDHITTGGVSIRKSEGSFYVILDEDFSLDGAPDPTLGFGNGEFVSETQFSALNKNEGFQSYKLPESFDPTEYSEVYVWCEKFGVALGVASLEG